MFYDRKQHNFLLKDGVAFRSVSSSLFFYEFHAYLLAHMHPLFFKKWVNPASFSFIFKQTIRFLQQINVKKCLTVHLVFEPTTIRTWVVTHNH